MSNPGQRAFDLKCGNANAFIDARILGKAARVCQPVFLKVGSVEVLRDRLGNFFRSDLPDIHGSILSFHACLTYHLAVFAVIPATQFNLDGTI